MVIVIACVTSLISAVACVSYVCSAQNIEVDATVSSL